MTENEVKCVALSKTEGDCKAVSKNDITFFEANKKYGELSNFYPVQIIYKGLVYSTSEHLYHALKYEYADMPQINNQMIDRIRTCTTPYKAKILANVYKKQSLRYSWQRDLEVIGRTLVSKGVRVRPDIENDDARLEIMAIVLRCKFTQNEHCRRVLIGTDESLLIENSPYDGFWGALNEGQNHLGRLLMDLRNELRNDKSSCALLSK